MCVVGKLICKTGKWRKKYCMARKLYTRHWMWRCIGIDSIL